MGILYEHWRTDLNECFYVGASWSNPDTRPYGLEDRNPKHLSVQNEVKLNGGKVEVRIIDCSCLTRDELSELETYQIAYWRELIGERLVNIAKGGQGFNFEYTEDLIDRRNKSRLKTLEDPWVYKVWYEAVLESARSDIKKQKTKETMSNPEIASRHAKNTSLSKTAFYDTPEGDRIRKEDSERKKTFAETEEGRKFYKDIGNKIVRFYKTEQGKATKRIAGRRLSETLLRNNTHRGERNGRARLTEQQAREIRMDTRPIPTIADEYGVHRDTIRDIKSGKNWGWVDSPLLPSEKFQRE
jgi:hypothetical protein